MVEYKNVWHEDVDEDLRVALAGEECWCVVLFEDGKQKEIIGWDGGEPEDQVLVRDWDWVADALKKAYDKGFEDGIMNEPEDI